MIAKASSKFTRGQENNRWHIVDVYKSSTGKYVVDIGYRTQWQGENDRDDVFVAGDEKGVRFALLDYDVLGPVVGYPSGTQYADKNAALRKKLTENYAVLVTEVFSELGFTERIEDALSPTLDGE